MIQVWLKYAAAFENGIDHGHWETVSPCFHSDATYERFSDDERLITPKVTGREAIVANFEKSVSFFDRRFSSRRINNLRIDTDGLTLSSFFTILYEVPQALPFKLIGSEEYIFDEDGLILSLKEAFAPGIGGELIEWLTKHGNALKPV